MSCERERPCWDVSHTHDLTSTNQNAGMMWRLSAAVRLRPNYVSRALTVGIWS